MSAPPPNELPQSPGYGKGVYRRRIVLEAGDGVVTGELEDDFHHFRAVLHHDGTRITRARGEALRMPWTTCGDAAAQLRSLEGAPVTRSLIAVAKHTNPRLQCTHTFDAATLAVAHAARQREDGGASVTRRYAVDIPDRISGRTAPELRRDGALLLRWELDRQQIESPEPFAGRALGGGAFARWCEESFPPDAAEAAQVMRRACHISMGRIYSFDEIPNATLFAGASGGACHTFQPGVVERAHRVKGSGRDFSDAAEAFHSQAARRKEG
jgi:hypothetical protein